MPHFPILELESLSASQLAPSADGSSPVVVRRAISSAFSAGGPGVILLRDLPPWYQAHRGRLLDAANALPYLPPDQLRLLEQPRRNYSTGWSHGREHFNGVPDLSKASFYANPLHDDPSLTDDPSLVARFPHDMSPNCWPSPDAAPHLEHSFKRVGKLISDLALRLAVHCDALVSASFPKASSSLQEALVSSRVPKGRLLHYFPSVQQQTPSNENDVSPSLWCGYHNDHGALTGLLPAQYYAPDNGPLQQQRKEQPNTSSSNSSSGLHVIPSDASSPRKVVIPPDCLAFQVGETAQILSGGTLRATPHAVLKFSHMPLARVTFAVFVQPNPWHPLRLPSHTSPSQALQTHPLVPSLRSRFRDGDLFGTFSANTLVKTSPE